MPGMIRKQIYIEARQETTLKHQAKSLGITEAEVIRRAIDCQMPSVHLGTRDPKAWEREKNFIAKRMAKGSATRKRRWKRDDAYKERRMRYGQ
jgi:hypothetical protein